MEKVTYLSTENVFKLSKRKDCDGSQTLAEMCSVYLGVELINSSELSDRVCKACGRRIRNASELLSVITRDINTIHAAKQDTITKRQLPTTVSSPERSPAVKKVLKISESEAPSRRSTFRKPAARKTLFDKENVENVEETSSGEHVGSKTTMDPLLSALNVDHLVEKKTTQAKVVIVLPSGLIKTYEWFDDMTKSLVINICRKNWKVVANIIFKHLELKDELLDPLKKTVSAEFKDYCTNSESESMLKQSYPTDLECFSNKLFLEEVRLSCPYWMSCLLGACKVSSDVKNIKQINAMALSTAVAARCRNQLMSAIAFRISAILFHSGVKHQDINRLHKLGICMSPEMVLEMERKMGKSCERKLQLWKKEIEENKAAELLLREIKEKQVTRIVTERTDDDMDVEVQVDMSESAIQEYEMFDKDVFQHCRTLVSSVEKDLSCVNGDDIEEVIGLQSQKKLPLYK